MHRGICQRSEFPAVAQKAEKLLDMLSFLVTSTTFLELKDLVLSSQLSPLACKTTAEKIVWEMIKYKKIKNAEIV